MKVFNYELKKHDFEKISFFIFLAGIFTLPSSFTLGIIFLLPAAVIGTIQKKELYLKDKWNIALLSCGILFLLNSILQKIFPYDGLLGIWEHNLTIYGLANWLPLFWIFWTFQTFLDSKSKRKAFILTSICGSFPILISGFGQYFFNWHGPLETLNGLIIWYQRPIVQPGGLTGLFNHQNYAGSWLNFIWPFCIALVLDKSRNLFKKSIGICFLVGVGTAAFLTNSRNSWLGLITTLPIMIGLDSGAFIIILLVIFSLIIFFYILNIFSIEIIEPIGKIIPGQILSEFSSEGYEELDVTRLEIMKSAWNISLLRPIIGLGAASFMALYQFRTGYWKGHSHNLFFETAISYGYPATIFLSTTIIILFFLSHKKIFYTKNNNESALYDKALWTSAIVFFISQIFDIQYFDGRMSLFIWTILAGLKNIIHEKSLAK